MNRTGAKGFIRGCYSSLFLDGFNRTGSAGALATHSFCHTFNLTQLLSRGHPQESTMSDNYIDRRDEDDIFVIMCEAYELKFPPPDTV
ncbi:hypothetical protein DICVIV_13245 [Dictyocaulus viviparus]|uniref:Uncharacterized protein n=1 Tax=Dictyocaulus viviparus TaxID=29172 RepID=A0A0D8XEF0_DICVI|nr:hypothetical protein DICVIV_13245 [Dictyocaulus viviparus]